MTFSLDFLMTAVGAVCYILANLIVGAWIHLAFTRNHHPRLWDVFTTGVLSTSLLAILLWIATII